MSRIRRPGALLFIAIAALSALVPGGLALAYALLEPEWALVADLVPAGAAPAAGDDAALTSPAPFILPSRAPPRSA